MCSPSGCWFFERCSFPYWSASSKAKPVTSLERCQNSLRMTFFTSKGDIFHWNSSFLTLSSFTRSILLLPFGIPASWSFHYDLHFAWLYSHSLYLLLLLLGCCNTLFERSNAFDDERFLEFSNRMMMMESSLLSTSASDLFGLPNLSQDLCDFETITST